MKIGRAVKGRAPGHGYDPRLQVRGLFLSEQAGQDAGSFVFAADRQLVLALAGTFAGTLTAAAAGHWQRGRPVRHWRRLFDCIDVGVNCGGRSKKINIWIVLTYRDIVFFRVCPLPFHIIFWR